MNKLLLTLLMAVAVMTVNAGQPKSPEEDPTACAVLVAKSITGPDEYYMILDVVEKIGSEKNKYAFNLIEYTISLKDSTNNLERKIEILTKSAYAYAERKRIDKATEILNQAEEEVKKSQNKEDLDYVFSCLSRANVITGDIKKALHFDKKTRHSDVNPSGIYQGIANYYRRKDQKEIALDYILKAHEIVDEMKRPEAKAMCQALIVYEYIKNGEPKKALKLAREISEDEKIIDSCAPWCNVKFKIQAFIDVAREYSRNGKKSEACKVLTEATRITSRIRNSELKAEMQHHIAVTYAGAGKYTERMLWTEFEQDNETPLFPDTSKGLEIARKIEKTDWKALALQWIAEKYLKSGDTKECITILSEALQYIKDTGKLSEYKYVLYFTAVGFAEAGEYKKALEIANYLSNINKYGISLSIAEEYLKRGEKTKARETLYKLLSLNKYDPRDEYVFLAKLGEIDKAVCLTDKLDKGHRIEVYKLIAINLAESGKVEKAIEIAAKISATWEQAEALAIIGNHYPKPGEEISEKSKEILRQIIKQTEDKDEAEGKND